MRLDADKGGNKALKVAASVSGVESVTVTGSGKDLLLVIGDGVDEGKLTKKLKKEVGEAEIVELRTLPSSTTSTSTTNASSASYYHHRTPSPGYYQHYAASPAAVAGGQGVYGYGYQHYAGGSSSGLYAREVARSHPANYSPMIARHDSRAVGWETPRAPGGEGRREHGGGGGPNCCSIL
ncbi:hypothetical protein HU200_027568 [Digitaria exilis]|uniref:Uncharacterized protein n=1 Tax=Digitaria exilis TaxID=1010633 RepID=A0A835ETK9_9POAL|nr:hypothetical protein HU200_027568 [Digitaria exilis]CAB3484800.1 unnamed protein product [Digitaria exilis]